jgi:hypothetical protein
MPELVLWLLLEPKAVTLVELLMMKHFIHISRSTRHILISKRHQRSFVSREKFV